MPIVVDPCATVDGGLSVTYRFGPYTLDPAAYRLLRDAEVIQLSPKIIDLLLYLVARQPALVSKEDLFKALWPDVAVTDNALTQAVSELRQALGDDSSKPVYIQTVARRGYRFIAPVSTSAPSGASSAPTAAAGGAAPEPFAQQPTIAVLDFANVSGDSELAWLSSGIAETVTNDLRSTAPLRVVDRMRVVEAVKRADPICRRSAPTCTSTLPSSAAFSGRARGCASPRAWSMPRQGKRRPRPRPTDRSSRSSSCRIESCRSSPRRWGSGRRQPRSLGDTSSLEAYRAFTEGRVRLESLDAAEVPAAVADFEQAIELDPRYAAAHVGLANATFWQYQMSRARNQPDAGLLARAVDHVRRAIELERDLADAYATLSFLLMSGGRAAEALTAARRAVALEPRYWGNQFRLAHAAWGEERLQALGRARDSIRTFRSSISKWPWCTSRAATSIERSPFCAREQSCRIARRTASSDIPRRASTGCSAWSGWRQGTRPRRCVSSSASTHPARGNCTHASSR